MDGQITNSVKKERSQKMLALTLKTEKEFLSSLVGTCTDVLFETEENGKWVGYTKNYARVEAESEAPLGGELKRVKITSVKNDSCEGVLI